MSSQNDGGRVGGEEGMRDGAGCVGSLLGMKGDARSGEECRS